MTTVEPRIFPSVDLAPAILDRIVRHVLGPACLVTIENIREGLTNTIFRIEIDRPPHVIGLRVLAGPPRSMQRELALLTRLAPQVPVPVVLGADVTGTVVPNPFVLFRWISGTSLNTVRRANPARAWLSLARPLGELLQVIHETDVQGVDLSTGEGVVEPRRYWVSEMLSLLADPRVVNRLGVRLVAHLHRLAVRGSERLGALGKTRGLVHGDFGGRNILASQTGPDEFQITGVIDWEHAHVGLGVRDVGSLFRYSHRYSEAFRKAFAEAYVGAGGTLSEDWWYTARLWDSPRILRIVSDARPLPTVHAECGYLLEQLVRDRTWT